MYGLGDELFESSQEIAQLKELLIVCYDFIRTENNDKTARQLLIKLLEKELSI